MARLTASNTALMVADAFGQAALQYLKGAHLLAIVVTRRDLVTQFAMFTDQAVGILFHGLSSFYRASASTELI
ncbi:hypothetical protein AZE99_01955 [Sphingorhabdus sp. M41]|nr:hypothetical protein AZE99_01955 [Sphingorhabdus sp. M41]